MKALWIHPQVKSKITKLVKSTRFRIMLIFKKIWPFKHADLESFKVLKIVFSKLIFFFFTDIVDLHFQVYNTVTQYFYRLYSLLLNVDSLPVEIGLKPVSMCFLQILLS